MVVDPARKKPGKPEEKTKTKARICKTVGAGASCETVTEPPKGDLP